MIDDCVGYTQIIGNVLNEITPNKINPKCKISTIVYAEPISD